MGKCLNDDDGDSDDDYDDDDNKNYVDNNMMAVNASLYMVFHVIIHLF